MPFNEDEYKAFFNGYNGTVKDIYLMLQQVLIFRNRVFHYEKVINDERFVNIDKVIKEVLKMIDVNLLNLVEDIKSLT